jgi:hypothetical protein
MHAPIDALYVAIHPMSEEKRCLPSGKYDKKAKASGYL